MHNVGNTVDRAKFANVKRVVIKIGSSLLTKGGLGLDKVAISAWVRQMAGLKEQSIDVVLVSSGSVAEGMSRLGLKVRPKTLHELQAAAAVGQMGLVRIFDDNFQQHGHHAAQVLLTHDDLSDRQRYLNARSTLLTLLDFGVVPSSTKTIPSPRRKSALAIMTPWRLWWPIWSRPNCLLF